MFWAGEHTCNSGQLPSKICPVDQNIASNLHKTWCHYVIVFRIGQGSGNWEWAWPHLTENWFRAPGEGHYLRVLTVTFFFRFLPVSSCHFSGLFYFPLPLHFILIGRTEKNKLSGVSVMFFVNLLWAYKIYILGELQFSQRESVCYNDYILCSIWSSHNASLLLLLPSPLLQISFCVLYIC